MKAVLYKDTQGATLRDIPVPRVSEGEALISVAASQTEPLACCLRNAKLLDLREGDTVGIIGLGAVGQMMGRLLHHVFASFHPAAHAQIDLNEIYHRELRPAGCLPSPPQAGVAR